MFSEDPALYRWQCWASNCQDPNSKDPTFVEDQRLLSSDGKVGSLDKIPNFFCFKEKSAVSLAFAAVTHVFFHKTTKR